VFDLSRDGIKAQVQDQINAERGAAKRPPTEFMLPNKASKRSCGSLLSDLVERLKVASSDFDSGLERPFKTPLVAFRSVRRHEAVAQLLGPNSALGRRFSEHPPPMRPADQREYLRKRTILELAFAAVKARGLLSIAPLATDRGGRYFDRLRSATPGASGEMWRELCETAGLVETNAFPDILVAVDELCPGEPEAKSVDAHRYLRTIDVGELTSRILRHVANPMTSANKQVLRRALDELQTGTEIELHSRVDRICAKTFVEPVTLKTRTALEAYTRDMLRDVSKSKPVQMISETGEWLDNDDIAAALADVPIQLIVAFDSRLDDLKERYPNPDCLTVRRTVDPWRHNRHMTLVEGRRSRAIYFYRRLRTPYVTPVYMQNAGDVERLQIGFMVTWGESEQIWPEPPVAAD
jgi:hypothetical protein